MLFAQNFLQIGYSMLANFDVVVFDGNRYGGELVRSLPGYPFRAFQ